MKIPYSENLPLLIQGGVMSIQVWIVSLVISLTIGTIVGILRSNRLRLFGLATFLDFVTFILRGVPFYVQLLIAYFVLPELIGFTSSPFATATVALGLCSAAYTSQIVRGALNALPSGQWEAAQVLGYSTTEALRFVILPQILKGALPAYVGEFDQLLKSTAVISSIGVLELTGAARNIIAQEMNPLFMYGIIAVMYLAMSSVLAAFSVFLEQRAQL